MLPQKSDPGDLSAGVNKRASDAVAEASRLKIDAEHRSSLVTLRTVPHSRSVATKRRPVPSDDRKSPERVRRCRAVGSVPPARTSFQLQGNRQMVISPES